jgi:peptide/nickel transport system permease protein
MMGFRGYLVRRITVAFIMLFVVMGLNYAIFFLMPGDPTALFVNPRGATQESKELLIARLRAQWGLDKPPEIRFLLYIKNMLTWDFGRSIITGESVQTEMGQRLFYTLELMGGSTVLSMVIGIALGVLVAQKRGGKFDSTMVTASLITYSLPVFWMGLVLILIFTMDLHWFPHANAMPYEWIQAGRMPIPYTFASVQAGSQWSGNMILNVNPTGFIDLISGYLLHLTLPLTTLTLFQYGGYVLLTRATMVEALTEDYVVTARAKGVQEQNVIFRHALKNASLPLITSAALAFGFMLSGAIITEGVFSWPGLGRWIFSAISLNDYTVLQAVFYVIAVCVIVANIVADILYGIVDPRIKYGA